MFRLAPCLLLMLLLLSAARAEATDPVAGAEGPAVRITRSDCARLVKHEPAPDVAYRPGVDVRGRPVVPADLEERALRLPEMIVVAITVDLQERFGIPASSALFQAEAVLGWVEVQDGRISFNGQPLNNGEILALAEACRRAAPHQP